jgi:predicted flavoprotein YhiN
VAAAETLERRICVSACDVLVIGAGAAGLMCAIEAARRGRRVSVIDHSGRPAEKIRISGGGRCNFTNLNVTPAQFLSSNPQFCVSALKRYSQHDFIARVTARGIAWHATGRPCRSSICCCMISKPLAVSSA